MREVVEPRWDDAAAILGVIHREDPHSNLIVNAFNEPGENAFRASALKAFNGDHDGDWKAYSRLRINGGMKAAIPDIVLACAEPAQIIVVENKLWAGEGLGQLKRYREPELKASLADMLEIETPRFKLVYLTLDEQPETNSADVEFDHISYRDFLEMTLGDLGPSDSTAIGLLFDLQRRVNEAHDWGAPDAESLRSWFELDGPPLLSDVMRLTRLMDKILNPSDAGLALHWVGKTNKPGVGVIPFVQFAVEQQGWASTPCGDGGFEDSFNVHFEVQWLGPGEDQGLDVLIHCETNPYRREKQAKDFPESHASFKGRRNEFKEELFLSLGLPWKRPKRQGWVTVARVVFKDNGRIPPSVSPELAGEIIQGALIDAVPHVDAAINAVWNNG